VGPVSFVEVDGGRKSRLRKKAYLRMLRSRSEEEVIAMIAGEMEGCLALEGG
jgi:hypothetical protein